MSNGSFLIATIRRAAIPLALSAAILALFPARTLAAPVDDLQTLIARYEKEAKAPRSHRA
ncbi:MAG: hypothetical protein HYX69_04070 [Planctomycetia bacterium]|nr:hypothetical protein [Planctomycetia bacterium]